MLAAVGTAIATTFKKSLLNLTAREQHSLIQTLILPNLVVNLV